MGLSWNVQPTCLSSPEMENIRPQGTPRFHAGPKSIPSCSSSIFLFRSEQNGDIPGYSR
ncbi:hypothetical protein PISMIDRAFT_676175 [Pisolithus microcarpus 441]|uniref:Uncharacterized protein n=1 Tax=Pisolithus microcarpus 441 TaxID=765257 RepID=A0A0C9ZAN5_9AGAM|nr:hypothetical protein PISMIDRAFT_676175 [Pisolithus microcarpus 441]